MGKKGEKANGHVVKGFHISLSCMGDGLGLEPQRKEGDVGVTGFGHRGPLLTSGLRG